MSFGWSASDIFQLIVTCHSVAANCRSGPTSAVFHLDALREETLGFESLLKQLHEIVKDGQETPCLDLHAIEETLNECKDYLKRYNAIQRSYEIGKKTQQQQASLSKGILNKSKYAAKLGGEIVKHLAWGEKEVSALQEKISHHKQTLTLYLTILERWVLPISFIRLEPNGIIRDKTSQIGETLRSVERMVHEIHAESISHTHLHPLSRTHSISVSAGQSKAPSHDRYETMLEAVERQRNFAMLERSLAGNADDREWENICDQLDLFHRRVLNAIERKANASAQQGGFTGNSTIQLNRALLSHNLTNSPLPPDTHKAHLGQADFHRSTGQFHGDTSTTLKFGSVDSTVTDLSSAVPSVFSAQHRLSICSDFTANESIDPLEANPWSACGSHRDSLTSHLSHLDDLSGHPSLPVALSPHQRRDTIASDGSRDHSTWRRLNMRGRIQIAWETHPTPVPCYLEAGYRSDGRMHAIKAVDLNNPQRQLPILKLSSTAKRPIPHSEPFDTRDPGYEAGRIYFVTPPVTKYGDAPQYVIEQWDDHYELQSLIYGKQLLLPIMVLKISSGHGKESDRQYLRDLELRRRRVFDELDATHFQTLVVFVAGIGFFTDGYDIFAVGMIIPMLAHVYWQGIMPVSMETGMRAATLVGTIIGQFGFGVLADLYGRRKMYGFELMIVTIATIGVAMAADGASGSMSLAGWLISWRFLMGIGIGGDYPLSAVITSEFAPTRSRARMISTVFYMQPVGYLMATLVAIIALAAHRKHIPHTIPTTEAEIRACTEDEACRRAVDSVWRWVIGIGAIPAVVAMLFRFSIPESPRYTMEVLNRPDEALRDVNDMKWDLGIPSSASQRDLERQGSPAATSRRSSTVSESHSANGRNAAGTEMSEIQAPVDHTSSRIGANRAPSYASSQTTVERPYNESLDDDSIEEPEKSSRWTQFQAGFIKHFIINGHWPTLLGTALAWVSFDFAYYALGPNSYKVVAKIFNENPLRFNGPEPLPFPTRSIYTDLLENSWHSLIIVSIGSLLGGLGMIKLIKHTSPRTIQIYGFVVLAIIFVAIGVCFQTMDRTKSVPLIALLYVLSQIFFEIGPNFTTFMIPAELFPTRYRCTAHGISAASGKVAAVLVQVFVAYVPIGPYRASDISAHWLGYVIIIFAAFMLIGAVVTKWLIPETRDSDGKNRSLEQLENAARVLRPRRGSVVSPATNSRGMNGVNGMPNGVH
ncbi:hypothetical protein PRK78_003105 [Emydomyces testavorans]|uniref:Major facilitator superfamily (MFS) profile domain-containing protein n=1 Tax=Emydomyces testavorans TaxID=2070801 RepID=A0AAF0DG63_9EURO|nr:hypothetical protein PRK78_003105 [Emydomyces testavorans]